MKTCKKLFSLLLVAVMLVAAIPTFAFADATVSNLYLSVDGTVQGPTPLTGFTTALTARTTYVASDADCMTTATTLLTKAGLSGTYDIAKYDVSAVVVDPDSGNASITMTTKACSHNWDYTDVGNEKQHLRICTICNAKEMVNHDWQEVTPETKPTHTSVGHAAVEQCKDCKKQRGGEELPKNENDHNFVKGACECGAKQYTINYKLNGQDVNETYIDKTGTADMGSAEKVLKILGKEPNTPYTTSGYNIDLQTLSISFTVTAEPATKSYTTLSLTVDGKTENFAIDPAYTKTGSLSNSDAAEILKRAGRSYDLSKYNVSVDTNSTAPTVKMTLNTIGRYTVNCIVNGERFAPKTNVPYYGTFTNSDAQAILKAADITVNGTYQQSVVSVSGSVITVELYNEIVVRVYNNANSFSQVTMRVGYPYINYLGTNLINNATFGGITIKNQAGQNTYKSASDVNGGKALVGAYDEEVTIQRNGDSCTLNFLRSDGTVLESRKLYAGDQIGTLPSYIVGNVPAVWTYNGKPISATDVYNFKTTSVNIQPYFGGISDVYVDVYTNGNVKTLQTRVKVTDMVQNGVLYLNSEVKSAISSALRNSSNKNLTYTAFFDASTWSDFIKTKNTNGAAEPIRVGDNSERQGSVYLYVMVNNVTQKATDSTNPKTGDDVKLGVAAAVLAVAVVGFGAAIVIKKKKGVQ